MTPQVFAQIIWALLICTAVSPFLFKFVLLQQMKKKRSVKLSAQPPTAPHHTTPDTPTCLSEYVCGLHAPHAARFDRLTSGSAASRRATGGSLRTTTTLSGCRSPRHTKLESSLKSVGGCGRSHHLLCVTHTHTALLSVCLSVCLSGWLWSTWCDCSGAAARCQPGHTGDRRPL